MKKSDHHQVEDLLYGLFGKQHVEVKFVLHPGVNMVSQALIAHFHLIRGQRVTQAMVKIAAGVGNMERSGGRLIAPHLRIPVEMQPHGSDYYIYNRVRGLTVDQLVRKLEYRENGKAYYLQAAAEHAAMWKRTLAPRRHDVPPIGYTSKVSTTCNRLREYTLWQTPLVALADRKIIVNGTELPSLNDSLARMSEVIAGAPVTVISHGDEGSCNVVVNREEEGTLYYIDHGTVGRRIIEEPMAKLLLWFPATTSEKLSFEIDIQPEAVVINYHVHLDQCITDMVAEAKQIMLSELEGKVDMTVFHACAMMYLLRELQWVGCRGRELMLAPLFAMAMEAAGAMWGALEQVPVLASV